MGKKSEQPLAFEQAMASLKQLVDEMEKGELSLDESLKKFEQGVALTKQCQQALAEAEQKVNILMEEQGKTRLQDFTTDDDAND